MNKGKMREVTATSLFVVLLFITSTQTVNVQAKTNVFTATINPAAVLINYLQNYTLTITNTGTSNLGSIGVAIPAGFTVSEPITILTPSLWNYNLSTATINLTANNGGATISNGNSLIFTFTATSPTSAGIATWITAATSGVNWGGTGLSIEGNQPSITISSPLSLTPPAISTPLSPINQGQSALLSQLVSPSGGTLPYNYQWLKSFNGESFSPISGADGDSYTFATITSTAVGTWSFKLNVTDSAPTPETVSSNTVEVAVNFALVAPEITANPNVIYQAQSSTLTGSPPTTGTSPYTFQWFQKAPGEDYISVGTNSLSYTFPGSSTIGMWTFLLQITDNTGARINSSETNIIACSTPIFNIIVTQSPHGTINPGTSTVNRGDTKSFNIIPDVGYQIANLLIDGTPIGPVASYTFSNIEAEHTITATFTQIEYALTLNVVGSGSVTNSPNQASYHYGDTVQLTAIPNSGWIFSTWTGSLTGSLNPSSIIIQGNSEITAIFLLNQFIITASSGEGGSISPLGTIIVDYNATQNFTITPDANYSITDVKVDGNSIGSVTSFTFTNIAANHNITANFAKIGNSFLINVISSHGLPTPSNYVSQGSNFNVSVNELEGDTNHRWICIGYTIDGGELISGTTYTFINVQENHAIIFDWQEQYSLTVTTSAGTTSGSGWYNAGTVTTATVSNNTIMNGNGIRQIFTGWTGDVTGTETTTNPIIMDGPKTVKANWKTQFYLTVTSSSGNPKGEGWYDAGTTANFSVEVPQSSNVDVGINLAWTGTQGGYTGTESSSAVTMNGPITEKATWTTQYRVAFAIIGNVLQIDVPQSEWVTSGATATGTFLSSITNSEGTIRNIFISDNRPSTITAPSIITGTYKTQYLVKFSQNGLNSNMSETIVTVLGEPRTSEQLPDSTWIEQGTSIEFTYVAAIINTQTKEQYILKNINCTSPLTINEPITIQAEYDLQTSLDLSSIALPALVVSCLVVSPLSVHAWRHRKRKIIPISDEGGSISPGTIQKIPPGDDSTVLIITARYGYKIVDVIIDNKTHLGAIRTYKFSNVRENHTIKAKFSRN